MRNVLTASVLALCFCAVAAAQSANKLTMEKPLAAGGTVALTMNVGELKIVPSNEKGMVRLEITTEHPADRATMASWVRQFSVAANRATMDIHMPKNHEHCADCYGNISVVVYVPRRSDLRAELGAGDLSIRGVTGNKDISLDVGDLRIGMGGPDAYGHIETHTKIGDIDDPFNPGGGASGFLGKTEDFNLKGQYHLQAKVGVGDIHLYKEGPQ